MQQKGLLAVGGNATIDNLSYTYLPNSNKLQKVTDSSPLVGGLGGASGALGDFKDSTNTNDDYTYDTNGNIVKDNNRNMQAAVFNLLDKPDSMAIAGKSCTYYTYDAAGSTLCKTVKDYKTNTVKRYTYIGGFVYLSNYALGASPAPDSLQYAMFEEGRIRWKAPAVVGGPSTVVFDYMIKDHAGNVRTVLTDEARRDDYPMASMETTPASSSATEEAIYAGLNQTRTPKAGISGYPADNTTTPNDFVAKVQATAGSQKVGPSITLKVMKGDTVNIKVNSWYKLNGSNPTTPQSPLVDIVNALISGVSGSAAVNTHNVTTTQLATNNAFTPDITQFLTNQSNSNYNTAKPKAYLNWIYFDEQFNIVSSSSGAQQVGNDVDFKLHVQQTVATKCGFLYVYVSNETPNVPVYFDNLQVSHARSPLLETNEYYPYGLKMASISYKASMTTTNRYGWNGGNEYEDEGELNYSNTFYRKYDAQIGRFTGVDMMAEKFAGINPYQFGANNPVMFNDPMGDQFGGANGERLGQMQAHLMNDTWGYNTSYGGSLESRVGNYGGEKATAAGKGYNDLFDTWDEIGFAKAEEGHYQFDKSGDLHFYGLEQVVIFGTFKGGEWKTRNIEYSGFGDGSPNSMLHSDCSSFTFVPVGSGKNKNYQSSGEVGVYFNWYTSFKNSSGKTVYGISQYRFNLLFFEFPRIRKGERQIITPGAAATIVSRVIDLVNDDLDNSPLATRDPAVYTTQNELYILRALQLSMQYLGGRVTKESQYGPVPLNRFNKSYFQNICY
jgi:RHS repeat-associated protein